MSVKAAYSHIAYRGIYHRDQQQQQQYLISRASYLLWPKNGNVWIAGRRNKKIQRRDLRLKALWPDLSKPSSVVMEFISDSEELDRILLEAQQNSQPILIDWMATWCRKCIYLKPKLEKLAAEFDNKLKFYCVDVNKVPQSLVKRGNISKMPTIQLWKDGEMKAEVIGGHKAWFVIEQVREMILKFV